MSELNDRVELYQDAAGEWRWNRKAANGRIIADSAEGYTTRDSALQAAVRVNPTTKVVDRG